MSIDLKKDIKMNELVEGWDKKKELIMLVGFTYLCTYIYGRHLDYIWNMNLYRFLKALIKILTMLPALFYLIKKKYNFKKLLIIRSGWEIVIGIIIALFITSVLTTICVLQGGELNFSISIGNAVYLIFHYFIIVALREEFIFRIAIMSCVEDNLKKHKALAPVITALIFSIWHIFNGTIIQVVITFFSGLIFGCTLYFVKKCSFVSEVIGHGLYDFMVVYMNVIIDF